MGIPATALRGLIAVVYSIIIAMVLTKLYIIHRAKQVGESHQDYCVERGYNPDTEFKPWKLLSGRTCAIDSCDNTPAHGGSVNYCPNHGG